MKRILSIALVLVMLMSVMGIAASAMDYYVPTTNTNYGYIAPTDAKGTKTISTVKLYGNYDYIDFSISSKYGDTYFFYEIYSSKNYSDKTMVDGGYFYCDAKGNYNGYALIKLSGVYKTGTYYIVTYAAKITASGSVCLSETSLREYKLVVDRTTAFNKQMTVTKGVSNTVNGPQIKWQGVSGATKYYIYRRPMTGTSWTKVGTANSSARSFVDKSVKNKNGKYVYTVKAVNKSNKATRYHYAGEDCLFAKAPTLKSVATGADNKIKIQWNSTSSSAYYEVYRREVGTSSWTKLTGNCKKTYFNDTKAVSGKTYEYTVRANIKTADGVARSAYYGNAGKAVKYLEAPNVTDVYKEGSGLCVLWTEVSGATAYTVYRRPLDGSAGWTTLKKVSSSITYFVDTTASLDSEYVYTVRAEGPKGRGSYFTDGIPYVNLQAPKVRASLDSSTNEITLKWNNVPNAQSYDVYCEHYVLHEAVTDTSVVVEPYSYENYFSVYAITTVVDGMTGKEITLISEPGTATIILDENFEY